MRGARRLSGQLIVWFSVIALVPLSIVTIATHLAAKRALHDQVTSGLFATAKRESAQLAAYLREREQHVATLAHLPATIDALADYGRSTAALSAAPALDSAAPQDRAFLSSYQESFGYDELALVLPDGQVAFAARSQAIVGTNLRADAERATPMGAAFNRIRRLLELDVSDFAPSENGEAVAYLGAPVLDKNRFLGVVLVRQNAREIYRILADHTGLGETGETLLSRQIGDSAVIIAPVRSGSAPPFSRRITLGSAAGVPEQQSVRGSAGQGETVDHGNRHVLAVWRYVPPLAAGLVVKIDTDEAYAPIRSLTWLALALAVTTMMIVVAAALTLGRSIAGPVVTLTEATSRIADGDLSRRVEVTATNEIGQLARSFNQMTERLARSIEELTITTAAKERIESELRVAHDIQMGILPKIFPAFPHRPEFDLHAMIVPAKQVGGDFYDFLLFDDQELYVCIGDVSGKGVPASLFMAVTLTLFRASVTRGMSPGALLTKLNRDLYVGNTSSLFVTVFCARLDVRTGALAFANGGHNPPYHVTAGGSASTLPMLGGPVLGILEQDSFGEGTRQLAPGDTLVLFTDGRDCRRRPPVRRQRAPIGRSDAARAALPRRPDRPAVSPKTLSLTRGNRLDEIAGVTERIEAFGAMHGLTAEDLFKLTLALDEVVTNIISYAYDDANDHQIEIRMDLNGTSVTVRVEDDGRAYNPLDAPKPELGADIEDRSIGGLGVHIVRSIMDELEYRREGGRNILIMRKRTPGETGPTGEAERSR